ncbi:uncharacterized protein FA14DRAFT_172733 [Meira miltonrushii]|uniref:RlpA-like protein double-psi beta-barrel domain-containing protein n=1 Tax=Meira miltonrushii TaxID=1280837 RepID=A0A316VEW3_9BASI|nr:uncharacterized protein FA14DRAFT_172733 [Meira miltonrushii]PWN36167.1 hypothetical protein FA14DRAFT_172733 [Meira miltonrushii]
MRFSFVAVAAMAVAVATSSVIAADAPAASAAPGSINAKTGVEDIPDSQIKVIEGGSGDHDFDEDDEAEDAIKPVRRSHKHKHKHRKSNKSSGHYVKVPKGAKMMYHGGEVTWYASHDLQNPQCGNGQWNPTNSCHIGAVMYGWNGGPECGEFVYICNSENNCIRVRIVDKCAGCKEGHIDLTKSAFKQVDPKHSLDTGVVKNLKIYYAGKPSPWEAALFGPLNLKG